MNGVITKYSNWSSEWDEF